MKIFDIEKVRRATSECEVSRSKNEEEIFSFIMNTAKRGRYNTAERPIHLTDGEVAQLNKDGFTVDRNRVEDSKQLYVICW